MFCGLTSRWTIYRLWMKSSAAASWRVKVFDSSSENFFRSPTQFLKMSPFIALKNVFCLVVHNLWSWKIWLDELVFKPSVSPSFEARWFTFFTIRRKLLESSNLHNTVSNIRITYFSEAMLLIQYAVKHNLGISINQVLSISWFPYRKQRNFNKFNPQITTEPRSWFGVTNKQLWWSLRDLRDDRHAKNSIISFDTLGTVST